MFSASNIFGQIMSALLTFIFTLEFSFFSFVGGVNEPLPKAPEDFEPVVRFSVCSDVHINGADDIEHSERFASVFKDSYKYASSCKYDKLDAVIVAGDFTGAGKPEQYEMFNKTVYENIKSQTKLLACLGNHEFINYRDYDSTIGYEMYKKYINKNVDTHDIINGYHFIGVSYADDAKTFNGKTEWLDEQIKLAIKDTGNKPIFVFQHPQPFNTVYGSINWGTTQIKAVLVKYPQVIDFSGHSHYANSDPRSVWQGSFTAVGTGSTAALMGNLNYINGDKDAPGESGGFWIVEADAKGNVRLQAYDVANHQFFEKNDFYLTDVAKLSAHKLTWGNLKSHDTAPEFPKDAEVVATKNNDGTVSVSFPDAECYWGAENYKISISNGFKTVWSDTVISNYVRTVSDGMTVNVGELESGVYTVRINPYSPYAKGGKSLKAQITVE